jgi:hypothetical protein
MRRITTLEPGTSQPQFLLSGIELILDPEAVDKDVGAGIHRVFEGGHPADQLIGGGMTGLVGDVLSQPAPERLDRHQVGAVARQRHDGDVQVCGGFPHHPGPVVWCAVPDHDQLARRDRLTQAA